MKTLKKRISQIFSLTVSVLLLFPGGTVLHAQVVSAPALGSAVPNNLVGVVAAAHGSVQISKSGEVGRVAGSGEPIYLGDEVSTDAKGQLQIMLLDETVFTIGPNSSIVIDTFVYDPATHDGKIDARVMKGVFRFITGQIAHKKPSNVEVKLPTGSVGVRGTIFYGKIEGDSSLILLLGPGEKNNTGHRQGRIIVSNEVNGKSVETEVKKSGFGTFIQGENIAPTAAFEVPRQQVDQMIAAVNPAQAPASERAEDHQNPAPDKQQSAQKNPQSDSEEQKPAQKDSSTASLSPQGDDKSANRTGDQKDGTSQGNDEKSALMGPPPGGHSVPGASSGPVKPLMMGSGPQERPMLPESGSATQMARQDKVAAYDFLRDLSQVNQVNNLLFDQSTISSIDSADTSTQTALRSGTGQATYD